MKMPRRWSIGVVVALSVVGGLGCLGFQRTPTHSLWQAKRALETHDIARFRRYVDVRGVSVSYVDTAMRAPIYDIDMTRMTPEDERERLAAAHRFEEMKLAHVDEIARRIEALVEKGDTPGAQARKYPIDGALTGSIRGLDYVHRDPAGAEAAYGPHAEAAYRIGSEPGTVVRVRLRLFDGRWQVVEILNAYELIQNAQSRERATP